MGLCVVEIVNISESKINSSKKSLEVSYFNNMFLDLLQVQENAKSKDIIKIFKEFIFFNEYENNSPNLNINFNFNNNLNNLNNSNEKINKNIQEESPTSDNLNKSKDIKDNFNTKTNISNSPIIFLSNVSGQNLNSNKNTYINKNINLNFPKNLNSSNSLKFVSRKSKLLRALDLYDILFNFKRNRNKQEDDIFIERKLEEEVEEEKVNLVENIDSNKTKKIGYSKNNGNFKSPKNVNFSFQDFEENESNKENVKNFDKKSKLTNNFKKYKKDVIEYRFMRHNLMFSVRIQEIENYLVLIFENLDEEKKQIQNNLIKSIKNQYIITISHELNNPLNGLIHCIEELDLEEEEKKKQVVNKIKRFKFLIKFFLKNIITNFKFFLNEPIEKRASNISFGFILESIKRSLFEFYEYKNITVVHDFSNLNNFVLNYDYFYFRYLLKNIFMYFYYKIPRNDKLIIEFEKESDMVDLNNLIRGNYTSEIGSSNESDKSSNEERESKNLNLRLKSKRSNNNNNTKTLKKKIKMIFKTEMQAGKTRKSSRNIFDKAFLENFDIENSIQTLEMLIESINKISKLLGIKIDFSNFNKKNTRIQMNLNYCLDEEDSCVYNDINEYNEEYDKYKANCVFSINRTLINEEKKIFLNPTLNMDFKSNQNKSSHFKYLGSNMNSSNLNFLPFNYTVRTFSSFDNYTPFNYTVKDNANNMNNYNVSKFNGLRFNNPNNNESDNFGGIGNSFLDSNKNANEVLSGINSRPITNNSINLSSSNKEIQEPVYSLNLSIRSVEPEIRQNEFNLKEGLLKKKSGYSIFKENAKKNKNDFNRDKPEASLFSKHRNSKNSDDNKIYQTTINQNFNEIFINQNEIGKAKEKYLTDIISSKKIFYLEEAINNSSDSMSKNDFEENLRENNFNSKRKRSSEFSQKDYDINSNNEKGFAFKNRAGSEVINSIASSESNSLCHQSSVKNIYLNPQENLQDGDYNNKPNRKIRNTDLQIVNEKNKNYFFNTYNTYLNINNVENLDVLNPSINNKNLLNNKNTKIYETNDPAIKDDFLTKYCRVKEKKYRSSSPDSNDNIANQYKQDKKFIIQEKNKLINHKEKNEKSPKNELFNIKEISKNVNIETKKNNSNFGKIKKNDLKDLMKNIEKNFNPKNFNFSNEIIRSQDSKEEIMDNILIKTDNFQSFEYENEIEYSSKECKNSSDTLNKNSKKMINENNSENNDEINENYDNFDQNLNSNLNKNYAQFAKNPFGKNDQNLNINYIRSPRLFFSCKIPSQIKTKRRNSKKSNNSSDNPDKPKCDCNDILLVDDELFNISSMKFLLKKKKLKADTAMNGRESIDRINEKLRIQCSECNQVEYKLIFMDIMMPELDGIEASKLIQEMVEKKSLSENVKILILTAHDTEIIRKRAAGIKIIKEFISKPVKKSIVDELLNKHYFNFHN